MEFEFDPEKSQANQTKHGIDFLEAQLLWLDDMLLDRPLQSEPAEAVSTGPCYFGGGEAVSTPRYDREHLAYKQVLSGPVIIEDPSSTIVIPPGARLTVDPTGHLLIDIMEGLK